MEEGAQLRVVLTVTGDARLDPEFLRHGAMAATVGKIIINLQRRYPIIFPLFLTISFLQRSTY